LAEEALSSVSRRLIEAHEEERTRIARELHDDINQRIALLVGNLQNAMQIFLQRGSEPWHEEACQLAADLGTISRPYRTACIPPSSNIWDS